MYFVDRTAVVLKPTDVFLNWLNEHEDNLPDLTIAQLRSNCTVFLVPIFDEPEEAMAYISERYQPIFVAELSSWSSDNSTWPKIDLENFWQFFELEIHDTVLDLEAAELQVTPVINEEEPIH